MFIFFQFFIGINIAFGQNVYLIDSISTVDVLKNALIYPTKNKIDFNNFKASLPEIQSQKNLNKSTENWIVFSVINQNPSGQLYYLETNFSDSTTLYNFETGKQIGKTGLGYQIGEISRNIQAGFIPIYFLSGENKKLLLKMNGSFPPISKVILKLTPGSTLNKYDKRSEIEAISISSVIVSFFIFNFLIFLIFRDKTYIYYLLYLINLGFWMVNLWLSRWIDLPISVYNIQHYINNVFLIFFNIAYISFALSYFQTSKKDKWYKYFLIYQFLYIIPLVVQLINDKNYYLHSEDTVLAILALGNIISVLIFSLSNLSSKSRATILFLIAETPLIISGLILGVEFLIIDADITQKIGPTVFKIGTLLEVLLFSFALGNRYRDQRIELSKQIDENAILKDQKLKEIQEIIQQKNIELENTVIERTSELELINQKLKRSNEEKTKIFSIIGHDLRSPLASLQAMFDLFIAGDLSVEEFKSLAGHVSLRLKGLNLSIQNLIIWAQSQMGGSNTKKTSIYLEELIREKLSLMQIAAEEKHISIDLDIDIDRAVTVDKNQVGVVIQNIINNAIKFTPRLGKIRISTSGIRDFEVIKIEDNGVGMTHELMNKINQNYLVESSLGTFGEVGTGLGLSICKEMIQKNDGEISLESEVNQGTIVSIKLPSTIK
nr:sensor histidine kinase [Pseudopedobacter sp.]